MGGVLILPLNDREVCAVIQAGGKGQRIQGASGPLPKPLVPVGGVPMIERLVRQLVVSGLRQITIIVGWQGHLIEAHLCHISRDLPGVDLRFLREIEPRGNVGSLADLDTEGRRVLFLFGDLVTDFDFSRLLALHLERSDDITLASHWQTNRLSLGELLVKADQVVGYHEKPEKRFLICSGIMVAKPSILKLVDKYRPMGLVDLVTAALESNCLVSHWTHGAFWMDVNTPEQLECAELRLSEPNSPLA